MKNLLKRILRFFWETVEKHRPADIDINKLTKVDMGSQILLSLKYKQLLQEGLSLPKFEDVEFRTFSQNGEDGILLYIFSLIGSTNKKAIEICAGDGITCNTANLIINHGWNGLLFDGKESNIRRGQEFYSSIKNTAKWPPTLVNAWITAENIDSLIATHGFSGEIDLLSLDLDGVDYWIWKAIQCISARVVVLEFNNLWGAEQSVTVPYSPDFRTEYNRFGADYSGASLPAFVKLAAEKGYRLAGCQRYGFNAFFIRSRIGEDIFPEIPASKCFDHPFSQYAIHQRRQKIIDREWVRV